MQSDRVRSPRSLLSHRSTNVRLGIPQDGMKLFYNLVDVDLAAHSHDDNWTLSLYTM